jgi:hypothetical protein
MLGVVRDDPRRLAHRVPGGVADRVPAGQRMTPALGPIDAAAVYGRVREHFGFAEDSGAERAMRRAFESRFFGAYEKAYGGEAEAAAVLSIVAAFQEALWAKSGDYDYMEMGH